MMHCRERALILLETAERTDNPEYKAKAAALAELWLTLATVNDALAIWAQERRWRRGCRQVGERRTITSAP